ncbi:MAG: four helix bundle protein [Candidatus Margulisbacteria bacterium]|nr:four helix bundle protein [Candidatus Margulisiibacteriota bacterium]
MNLRERLLKFAKRCIEISKILPKSYECESLKRQLINAATSIGANFEEADGALSKKDFINKVAISRKEAKETRYWLAVISGSFVDPKIVADDIDEAGQIVKILSAILIKMGATVKR